MSNGIVSGTNYTKKSGCQPYPFPPCDHGSKSNVFPPCQRTAFKTPNCQQTCQSSFNNKTYNNDKYYGILKIIINYINKIKFFFKNNYHLKNFIRIKY